ncbi:serine/threonine-protein kinase [Polyangium sorediatum]|uniref:Serine/threonine-protein kinase n=1 Tax=Polyangium sorediatum TaxID=889274 RepID=A0ABT6P8U8_9BACT|nr:serine/threonine-protein kinase [Polyangium sorediatum]MDI1437039.1 serine/threonine-protein kinase [Polyangium sorediatum]
MIASVVSMMVAPPPGTILLGKYRVEQELGCGGMGVVLEATHLALGQTVAIKLLNPALALSSDVVTRFLREARIAATLPSEHIARVSDVGQTETGAPYLVMERLYGHDLEAELTRRGKLPVAEAVDLALEACEGIAAAHAQGLVHRDLKPANLFLAERPLRPRVLKVLDFGLSKDAPGHSASITGTDAVFGTPQYMSPEQIQSTKNVDARSDQHALGMILYEMLAGAPPYAAESITQLIVVIATQPPPRVREKRPEVAARLEEAILRALAKRPHERFADLGAFSEAIAPFGGPEARTRATRIGQALVGTASLDITGPGRPSRVPTDQAITLPRAPAHTHAGFTSSVDLGDARGRKKRAAIFATGGLVATALLVSLVVVTQHAATPEATTTPPEATPAARAPEPTTPPPPQVTAAAPPPAATSSAATSTTPAKTTKAPTPTKTSKQTQTIKQTVGIFGGKRK